jgi:hypothetical protein
MKTKFRDEKPKNRPDVKTTDWYSDMVEYHLVIIGPEEVKKNLYDFFSHSGYGGFVFEAPRDFLNALHALSKIKPEVAIVVNFIEPETGEHRTATFGNGVQASSIPGYVTPSWCDPNLPF